jgi:diguanylate cyclase (GGDEF)-like protein/PAS domain S-box-containing protein
MQEAKPQGMRFRIMAHTQPKGIGRISYPAELPSSEAKYLPLPVDYMRSMEPGKGLRRTLEAVARNSALISREEGCVIHLLNKKRNLLEGVLRKKVGKAYAEPVKAGEGSPWSAFARKKVIRGSLLRGDFPTLWKEEARKEGLVSALCLPLRGRRNTIGTLTILSRKPRRYGAGEIAVLAALADQAAVAVENARTYEKMREKAKNIFRERKREREVKKFLENIVDRSVDPIMATDLQGRFTFVSRSAEEMLGRSKEELLGKRISAFYAGKEGEAQKIMGALTRKEKLRHYETEFIRTDGKRISVILSASLLKDVRGNPVGTLGVSREITEYKNLLDRINRTERSYQKLFEAVNDAIFYLNSRGHFATFNRMFLKMTGYTAKEIRKVHFSKIIHPDDLPRMLNDHQKVVPGEDTPERYTFRLIDKDKKVIYVEGNFRRLKEKKEVMGTLAVLRDVTEKIRLEKELLKLSITDGLTGLHNQRHFYDELDREMERTRRQRSALSLLLFDLDDFKTFNDIHGHLEGDKVLKSVAQAVLKSIRRMDSAYRYGGDEFTVILPGAGKAEGTQVAERIRKTFEKIPSLQSIRLSIGLVEFDPQYDLTSLIRRADEAMYAAKKRGGNQIFIGPGQGSHPEQNEEKALAAP